MAQVVVWNNLTVCTQGSYRTLQKCWFASSFPGESPDRAIDQALQLLVQCREARAQQSLHGGPGSAEGTCKSMLSWAQMVPAQCDLEPEWPLGAAGELPCGKVEGKAGGRPLAVTSAASPTGRPQAGWDFRLGEARWERPKGR